MPDFQKEEEFSGSQVSASIQYVGHICTKWMALTFQYNISILYIFNSYI